MGLDFSKAFDTVRHSTLFGKLSSWPIKYNIFNWIMSFMRGRQHCTKSNGVTSPSLPINASVVQGSALGPTTFIVTASDLKAITAGNSLFKYADDTYLLVPAANSDTISKELENIKRWAEQNNLQLNVSKSIEMIVQRPRSKCTNIPPPLTGIERVDSMKILGVIVQRDLRMTEHVNAIASSASQQLYVLKILKAHGLPSQSLSVVCRSTLISKLTYASPSWLGYTSSSEADQLTSIVRRATRWGLYSGSSIEEIKARADDRLFEKVLSNIKHVLHSLLPPIRQLNYNLRPRGHNRLLPLKTTALSKNFLQRMLYHEI